jgi:hypothetical protein
VGGQNAQVAQGFLVFGYSALITAVISFVMGLWRGFNAWKAMQQLCQELLLCYLVRTGSACRAPAHATIVIASNGRP